MKSVLKQKYSRKDYDNLYYGIQEYFGKRWKRIADWFYSGSYDIAESELEDIKAIIKTMKKLHEE